MTAPFLAPTSQIALGRVAADGWHGQRAPGRT